MEKDEKNDSGHRPFLSLLSSVWQGHERGGDKSSDKATHNGDVSRGSGSMRLSAESRKGKAIHTIGEGSFSLDDLDESCNKPKRDSAKKAVTNDEKTVQQQLPDLIFASEKRNADFHKIFAQSVDPKESLIEDCSCALTREILIQGRFYVTAHHVCFHSNILGRTTHLVASFQEILEFKTKNTVGLFPNGIVIRTLHAQHTFASFVNRDHVIKLLRRLKDSTLNSRKESGEFGDSAAVTETSSLDDSEASDQWNEESSFKRRRSYSSSFSFNSSGLGDSEDEYSSSVNAAKGRSRTEKGKTRPKLLKNASKDNSGSSSGAENGDGDAGTAPSGKWPVENLGPATHKPTNFPDLESKEKHVDTFTVAAPLGVVANLVYGKDTDWFYHFQTADLKNRDFESIPPFKKKEGKEQRYFEYVKPLSGPVGPKQTKCKCTETVENWDMEDHVQVLISNKTPDVPSGDSFTTFTRCTMAWAEGNKTSIRHSTSIEWTGKSWLKKPIENGAMDGQQQYCKALNSALQEKLRSKSAGGGKSKKNRKRDKKASTHSSPEPAQGSDGGWFDWSQYSGYAVYALAAIAAIVAFVILRFIYNYFTSGKSQQHKILQHQIDLWQWLDSRLENRNTFDEITGTLSVREIDEVIKLTELRLGRLRAIRDNRT